MKKGHFVRYCKFQKSLVPKDIFKWIPKCIDGSKDRSNTKGPKFFKGSNLVISQVLFCRFLIVLEGSERSGPQEDLCACQNLVLIT